MHKQTLQQILLQSTLIRLKLIKVPKMGCNILLSVTKESGVRYLLNVLVKR